MRPEQCPGSQARAETENAFSPHASGGKIDVLDNVVQSDVGIIAGGSRQSRRREPGECSKGILRCGKAGEDKVVPNDIRL